MKKTIQFRLKAGERLYVNGAVLKVDRKVAVEFLNDVTFLLDSHVLQPEDTTTPLKQLYFLLQCKLTDPESARELDPVLNRALLDTTTAFSNEEVLAGLREIAFLASRSRYFDCLKILRRLFPVEADILAKRETPAIEHIESRHKEGAQAWK